MSCAEASRQVVDQRLESLSAKAVLIVRKMRGGSQSFLVGADDGNFYVVKTCIPLQGPCVLANEVIGCELLKSVGLPTPGWKRIYISAEMVALNRVLGYETEAGWIPVQPGWHFGSHFVGTEANVELYQFLPKSAIKRIDNSDDFLGMYLFDVWTKHTDCRQALFLKHLESKTFQAVFIDHGHLFGGPSWSMEASIGAGMYLDATVYDPPFPRADVEAWISRFQTKAPPCLETVREKMPPEWYNFNNIEALIASLCLRLGKLPELFEFEVNNNPRLKASKQANANETDLSLHNSRVLQVRRISGWRSVPSGLGG